jgi:hypothetical protein
LLFLKISQDLKFVIIIFDFTVLYGVKDTLLGPAKEALGDDVSYGEIKCVLKHLEHLQKHKNVAQR